MTIIGAGAGKPPGGGAKSPHVTDGSDQTFMTDVIEPSRSVPVIVDFWATWCGPCRAMAPVFEQAAARLEPGVRLVKLDTDANPELSERLGIRSIPTLVLFQGARERARHSGALPLGALVEWVEAQL